MKITLEIKEGDGFIKSLAEEIVKKIDLNMLTNESTDTYTVDKIAKITGKHRNTISFHIKKGLLIAKKNGKSYTITSTNLHKYLNHEKTNE